MSVARDATKVVLVPRPASGKNKIAQEAEIEPMYPGAIAPSGTVRFVLKNKTLGTIPVAGGEATLMMKARGLQLKAITVIYSGDGNYASSMSGPATPVRKPHRGPALRTESERVIEDAKDGRWRLSAR